MFDRTNISVKKEVITKLKDNEIKYYPPIEKATYNKRIAIKTYNDEEQEQFLNKGYEVIDPLKSKGEYFNIKSGKNEIVELLTHQEKFLRKFFLSNVMGSIVFHGVGTGKSLTAAAASHYYLSLNPNGHIVFVSPPALIANFINALKQYGLDVKDKRYSFYSFEKFTRNPNIQNKKCLFIVDEAHILRTEINVSESVNMDGQTVKQVNKNKRGYAVLEAIKKIDKCILLTGTPFINKLYDIENLLSMVTKKDPLDEGNFSQMITNTASRHDYFRYRISHYENEVGSEFFPKKIQEYIPLVMDDGELKRYNDFIKINENQETETPVKPETAPTETPTTTPTTAPTIAPIAVPHPIPNGVQVLIPSLNPMDAPATKPDKAPPRQLASALPPLNSIILSFVIFFIIFFIFFENLIHTM